MSEWRAVVVTVSDRCAAGEGIDQSGPLIIDRLTSLTCRILAHHTVPDDATRIREVAGEAIAAADLAVFTGGTGLGPRDVTPQSLRPLLDYEVPGIAEAMRAHGLGKTAHAMLSRQLAGVAGGCLILALPGSARAVIDCLDAVLPVLPHALTLLAGETSQHPPPEPA